MNNLELLFKNNITKEGKKIKIGKGCYCFKITDSTLNIDCIFEVLKFINNILHNTPYNLPICLVFIRIKGSVKLPLILLECIVYYIFSVYNKQINIFIKAKTNVYTNYLKISPLLSLNHFDKHTKEKFIKKFCIDISMYHYRRKIIAKDAIETDELSKLYDDVYHFLMNNNTRENVADNIAEVVVELIGNAFEHGNSDCLLDIDFEEGVYNKKNDKQYYAINICVLNFCEKLFYQDIKSKLAKMNTKDDQHPRYMALKKAYEYHKKQFNEIYTEEDFFTVAAYQHRITGRKEDLSTMGGTGLTKLIKNIQLQSVVSNCFMISGNKILWFDKKLLEYDNDGWLGFNSTKNFFNDIPVTSQFLKKKFYMPGTAYNLNFIIEKEY